MRHLPKAKNQEIIQQELGKELLIYDLQTNTAYSLNETSRIIYRACNGVTTFDELKRQYKFTDDFILFALDELNRNNLLEDHSADNFAGMSRRQVIRQLGLGSMVMLPVIASIVAPTSANAASGASGFANGVACTTNNQCASGDCSPSKRTCCTRLPNGSGDLSPCTTTADCCLSATTSRCQSGVCCRNSGVLCEANGFYNDSICCSGTCSRTTGTCT